MSARSGRSEAVVETLGHARDPWELFHRVSHEPLPVLLHSSKSDPVMGRCSIIAWDPFLVLRYRKGRGAVRSRVREANFAGDPFPVLRAELDRHWVAPVPGIPFVGGAIGYLGYPLRQWTGERSRHVTTPSPRMDLHLAFYDRAYVVDHAAGLTHLVSTGMAESSPSRRLEKQKLDLRRMREPSEEWTGRAAAGTDAGSGSIKFLMSREAYLRKIRQAQEYLQAGDIYQVNLSHRIEVEGDWAEASLYQQLAATHPGCFSAYLPFEDHAVLCASPERLVKLWGRRVETRPIKGTRARGVTPGEDCQARSALASGAKERAENVMIVDLARNDLGRVCVPGSVATEDLCRVETLPTVHHLVSTVSGILRDDSDRVDLVQALFPGGSMTGAPKIRAMEIIDELEGEERGIYSGSIGYFSFDGDLDLNIVIRTIILAGRTAQLQVGGAVMAESEPEAEYQETLDKARPLLELLAGSDGRRREGIEDE
ncbi:MAG: aminodeoxychorismate synthase component I [Acidobacteria bacterium]|nr:aminodeoxychorismate synthase component I [Acidobacteriota bacterium]